MQIPFGCLLVVPALILYPITNALEQVSPLEPITVTSASSGTPLSGAWITVVNGDQSIFNTTTDAEGRFSLNANGDFRLVVGKAGYLSRTLSGTAIRGLRHIHLKREAAITGRTVDELGEPLVGASVLARFIGGPSAAGQSDRRVATDDRGEYRIYGLDSGSFIVFVDGAAATGLTAGVASTPSTTESRTYFPGVASQSDASVIVLENGSDRGGVDFVLPRSPVTSQPIVSSGSASPHTDAASIAVHVGEPSGYGLSQALVRLVNEADTQIVRTATSDDRGNAMLTNLPPGRYAIMASKSGYQANDDASQPTVVAAVRGRRVSVAVSLIRLGAITTRILDEFGDPFEGATATLFRTTYRQGRSELTPAASPRKADDRGIVRFGNLLAGRYLVSATTETSVARERPGYAPSFFPGTIDPSSAQTLALSPGEELQDVSLTLVRASSSHIRVTVESSSGIPSTTGMILLQRMTTNRVALPPRIGTTTVTAGQVDFDGVSEGEYTIYVDRGRVRTSSEGEFAAVPITVAAGRDLGRIVVRTTAASKITGTVKVDTSVREADEPWSIEVGALAVNSDRAPRAVATATVPVPGSFELDVVPGQRRFVVTHKPPQLSVRRILADGIDVTDEPVLIGPPLQVTVELQPSSEAGAIAGTVMRKAEVIGGFVVVFSTDPNRWYEGSRFRKVQNCTPDGKFLIADLPTDTYYVAFSDQTQASTAELLTPELLQNVVARASQVSVHPRSTSNVVLKAQ